MAQVSLANYDHVIRAFAFDRADQSFGSRSAKEIAALSVCRECPSLECVG